MPAETNGNRDTEGFVERLVTLFEATRSQVSSALVAEGQPLTVAEQRWLVVPNEEGTGLHAEHVFRETNVLKTMVRTTFPEVLAGWLVDARVVAAELAQAFSEHVPISMAFPPPGLDLVGLSYGDIDKEDPAQWVLGYMILAATYWYLTQLPSVATPDVAMCRQVASQLVDVLSTGRLMARQVIAIEGVVPEYDFLECGTNRLRALSPLERGDLLKVSQMRPGVAYLGHAPDMSWPTHVLEMDREVESPNELGLLPVPRLLTALQLHHVTWSGPGGLVTYLLPEWLSFGRLTRPLGMRRWTREACRLSQQQFEGACATAEQLGSYRLDVPERPSELALHRFGLGCSRPDAADGLLDFVVALEALLLPYDREVRFADLSYRFRLHGAYFIADAVHERRPILRALNRLYDIRSRLVHGDNYPDAADTLETAREARQLAARGLLKAVRNGFPDVAYFTRLALGELP